MKEIEKYKIYAVITLMILAGLCGVALFGSFSFGMAQEGNLFVSAGNYVAANNLYSHSEMYGEFALFFKALTLVGVLLLLLNLSQLAITKIDFMNAVENNPGVMTGFMQMLGLLAIAIAIIMTFSYSAKSEQMRSGQIAKEMIKEFEGLRTSTYLDAVGVPTIGYGTTKKIKVGMKISEKYAEVLLKRDLFGFENYLNRTIFRKFSEYEYDALISFIYNIGSLYGNMRRAVIIGNQRNIVYWMNKYVRAGGRVLKGLIKRRKIESEVYSGKCQTIKRYNRCFAC